MGSDQLLSDSNNWLPHTHTLTRDAEHQLRGTTQGSSKSSKDGFSFYKYTAIFGGTMLCVQSGSEKGVPPCFLVDDAFLAFCV